MACWLLLDSDCCQPLRLGLLLVGRLSDLCLTFPSSQGCSAECDRGHRRAVKHTAGHTLRTLRRAEERLPVRSANKSMMSLLVREAQVDCAAQTGVWEGVPPRLRAMGRYCWFGQVALAGTRSGIPDTPAFLRSPAGPGGSPSPGETLTWGSPDTDSVGERLWAGPLGGCS